MPPILLAIPAAAALAWWLLRGGPMRRRAPREGAPPGDVDGALEPGGTRRLALGEEEPFKREELPFERLYGTGGEVGGFYGPATQEQPASAPEGGFHESPAPTQTYLLSGDVVAVPTPLWGGVPGGGLPPGGDYGGYVPGSGVITSFGPSEVYVPGSSTPLPAGTLPTGGKVLAM